MVRQKRNRKTLRILIFEDDEMQASLLEHRLRAYVQERGFAAQISVAGTKSETINVLNAGGSVDVAIVDVGLPTVDAIDEYEEGIAVIKTMIRKDIPIVVVTAIQVAGFQRLAEKHAIDRGELESMPVFAKPFFPDDVCHATLRVIHRR